MESGASKLKLKRGQDVLLTQTQKNKLDTITKLLDELEQYEKFVSNFRDILQMKNTKKLACIELEQDLSKVIKEKATNIMTNDNKLLASRTSEKFDAVLGNFLSRVSSIEGEASNLKKIHEQELLNHFQQESSKLTSDLTYSKDKLNNFVDIRDNFFESSAKIRAINKNKQVDLSKLERVEQENEIKSFENVETDTINTFHTQLAKIKFNLSDYFTHYVELQMEFHKKSLQNLAKLNEDIAQMKIIRKEEETNSQKKLNPWKNAGVISKRTLGTFSDEALTELTNGLKFPCSFSVRATDRKKSPLNISIHKDTKSIIIAHEKFIIDDLWQVSRLKGCQIRIDWKNGRIEKYNFPDVISRETFVECFWLLKDGLDRPISKNRMSHVTASLPVRMAEKLKIVCGTWNLGDAPPNWETDPLETWLIPGQDIYAVGTQECQYAPRYGFSSCEEDFFGWIGSYLGDEYVKLAGTSLWSIRMVVFVKRCHYYKVSNLRFCTVPTGIGNIIGNKGAAAVSFSIYETSFCFVGTHLAARIERNRLLARNQNYRDIICRMPFSSNSDNHNEFDHMFWMGDLNFRLELDRKNIEEALKKKDYRTLLRYDQLFNERNLRNCFDLFQEGNITFEPTYRYERGSRQYSLEKMREPAYCDRILWKSVFKDRVKLLEYNSTDKLMTSDHSPVYAIFEVKVCYPVLPHNRQKCEILIENLKISDFNYSSAKKSDNETYYLSFQAPWISEKNHVINYVVERTDNNTFSAKVPVAIEPTVTAAYYLPLQWFRVVVKDVPSKNTICTGAIPLSSEGPFTCYLTERGTPCGKLEGNLVMKNIPIPTNTIRVTDNIGLYRRGSLSRSNIISSEGIEEETDEYESYSSPKKYDDEEDDLQKIKKSTTLTRSKTDQISPSPRGLSPSSPDSIKMPSSGELKFIKKGNIKRTATTQHDHQSIDIDKAETKRDWNLTFREPKKPVDAPRISDFFGSQRNLETKPSAREFKEEEKPKEKIPEEKEKDTEEKERDKEVDPETIL